MNFNNLDINSVATLISCFLSAYFGYKTSKWSAKSPLKLHTYKKQLSLVYLPLFKEIYPYMYNEISYEQSKCLVSKFNKIVNDHFELINPNLISAFLSFEKSLHLHYVSKKEFDKICSIIDTDFENIRKSLGLPYRNLIYKCKNKEHLNKLFNIFTPDFLVYRITTFLLCLLIGLLVFIVINIVVKAINDGAFTSFETFLNYNL